MSIYKLSNGKHIDLSKILVMGPVIGVIDDASSLVFGAMFELEMQLFDNKIELSWWKKGSGDITDIEKHVKKQHDDLLIAWKNYEKNKKFRDMANAPWKLYYEDNVCYISSNDCLYDVLLKVMGNFKNIEQKDKYCQLLADKLNDK